MGEIAGIFGMIFYLGYAYFVTSVIVGGDDQSCCFFLCMLFVTVYPIVGLTVYAAQCGSHVSTGSVIVVCSLILCSPLFLALIARIVSKHER